MLWTRKPLARKTRRKAARMGRAANHRWEIKSWLGGTVDGSSHGVDSNHRRPEKTQRAEIESLRKRCSASAGGVCNKDFDGVGPNGNIVIGMRLDLMMRGANKENVEILCVWGAKAEPKRVENIMSIFRESGVKIYCLGTTKDGHPRHPFYVPYSQEFCVFNPNIRRGGKHERIIIRDQKQTQ